MLMGVLSPFGAWYFSSVGHCTKNLKVWVIFKERDECRMDQNQPSLLFRWKSYGQYDLYLLKV